MCQSYIRKTYETGIKLKIMKNIKIIEKNAVDEFIFNLWRSEEFKTLHKENLFFRDLLNQIKKAPLYFYDISHPQGRNHLTSIFRCIPYRHYDNEYINDLYYLHEICHCAQYVPNESNDYKQWSEKLSINELYSSLVSEVFIYFFAPSLLTKTFSPLWVELFVKEVINNPMYEQSKYGLFYHLQDDMSLINGTENSNEIQNIFNLNGINNYPQNIKKIIQRRQYLRGLTCADNLSPAEKIIVNYNNSHKKWLLLWEKHYLKIDIALNLLMNGKYSSEDFLNYIQENCDQLGRPFYPK